MPLFGSIYKLLMFLVRYTRHIRNAHLMGAGVIVAAVASGVANTLLVAMVNRVINDARPGTSLLALFLGICVAFPLLRFTGDMLLARLTARATTHLRMTLASRILAVPLRRLEELGPAKVNVTLLEDLPTVIGSMTLIPLLTLNVTVVLGCLVYMGWLSWQMLLGVIAVLAVGVVAYQLPLARAQVHVRALRERADDLFRHLRALTDAVKELKLHRGRRDAFLQEQLRATAVAVQGHSVLAQRSFSLAVSFGQVLIFLLIAAVVFALPAFTTVERPVLTGYTFAILYMVGPVQVILNSMAQLTRATTAMDRVEKMGLQLADAALAPLPALPAPAAEDARWSSVELRGVTHTYHTEREGAFTLGPLDLSFRPGELVFITGGNGSGKTTLAKLLTGLYLPETGEVRLDGEPVGEGSLERYYALWTVVFSDYYLFDSLLGLGRDALDDDALHYLRELQIDHKVRVEEGKLSTTELSQGQRKRLALLTAYLEDRPIYLFDEWAADQDPHFKDVFYRELLPAMRARGKTVFVISHDDRYYDVADRLIKLDYGRIVLDARPEPRALPAGIALAGVPAAAPVAQEA